MFGLEEDLNVKNALGVTILIFSLWFFSRKPSQKQPSTLVRPPGIPFLGHVFDLIPEKMLENLPRLVRKHGPILELFALQQRIFVIADLETAKEVNSKRPKIFRRPKALDYAGDALKFSEFGVFHTHGANWSRMRKATSPSLAKHHMISSVLAIVDEGLALVERLAASADGVAAVDMRDALFQYTLRVICHTAFGSIAMDGARKDYFFGRQFQADILANFIFSIETMTFPLPMWVWRLLPAYYKLETDAHEGDARFTAQCQQIITEKRRELAAHPDDIDRNGVIDVLLRKGADDSAEETALNDVEILANVKTFFTAGSDTTSVTISWALFYLAQRPDILADVRVETAAFYAHYARADKSPESVWAMLTAEQMPLTNAVVRETLRLKSPGPLIFHQLESDTEPHTLSGGLVIQPADQVVTYSDLISWDEGVYANPAAFEPRRWLTADKALLARMDASFFAFGHGPRQCPGIVLAGVESIVGLSAVVHHFDFALACRPQDVKRTFYFVAAPSQLPMTLRKRAV